MLKAQVRVGITMGDPAGIGAEIILKSLPHLKGLAEITVIGDNGVFSRLGGDALITKAARLVDLKNVRRQGFSFGKLKAAHGRSSMEYLECALSLICSKEIDCLVTAPISKEAINKAGFKFPGHTEYFADCVGAPHTVMMLLNRYLKFSLVTRHVSLRNVAGLLNEKELMRVIRITFGALKNQFGVKEPRIAVCGLNPHASDNGVIGKEENAVIKPALRKLKFLKRHLIGPLASDIAIAGAYKKEYDAVIAMYHDQALIPLKLSDPYSGVNMTLGLPFIRTSPLHGTAFDIAGKNLARPQSMIEAVRLAARCAGNIKHQR